MAKLKSGAKSKSGIAGAAILVLATQALVGPALAAPLDARRPADLAAMLKEAGVEGELKTDDRGHVYLAAKQDGLSFSVEFRDCDAAKTRCAVAYYMASWTMASPSAEVLNLWNDVNYFCAAFQGANGEPYVKMGFLPKATDTKAGLLEDHGKWLACVEQFKSLLADPEAFQKSIG